MFLFALFLLKLSKTVEEFKAKPLFVGCRHILPVETDDWLVREDVLKGLSVLQQNDVPFDLVVL